MNDPRNLASIAQTLPAGTRGGFPTGISSPSPEFPNHRPPDQTIPADTGTGLGKEVFLRRR